MTSTNVFPMLNMLDMEVWQSFKLHSVTIIRHQTLSEMKLICTKNGQCRIVHSLG